MPTTGTFGLLSEADRVSNYNMSDVYGLLRLQQKGGGPYLGSCSLPIALDEPEPPPQIKLSQ